MSPLPWQRACTKTILLAAAGHRECRAKHMPKSCTHVQIGTHLLFGNGLFPGDWCQDGRLGRRDPLNRSGWAVVARALGRLFRGRFAFFGFACNKLIIAVVVIVGGVALALAHIGAVPRFSALVGSLFLEHSLARGLLALGWGARVARLQLLLL